MTLGEGMTPLLRADRLGQHLGLGQLCIKDEGQNPTASFKARGLSAAVTMAKALGIDTIALPTAAATEAIGCDALVTRDSGWVPERTAAGDRSGCSTRLAYAGIGSLLAGELHGPDALINACQRERMVWVQAAKRRAGGSQARVFQRAGVPQRERREDVPNTSTRVRLGS